MRTRVTTCCCSLSQAETEKVSQKVREAKKREKALLFKQLQQEADQLEAEDDMDPAPLLALSFSYDGKAGLVPA